MLHIKNNREKVLQLFFDFPNEQFHLREISRKAGVAVTSVRNYLDKFLKEGLIIKIEKGIYPSFKANRDDDSSLFRFYKKLNLVESLNSSGLLSYLEEKCAPNSIILFGSAPKGEDISSSDVDLFVESSEMKLELKSFEKKLNRKISIFFEPNFARLTNELKNNILNGIILKGYIEVFK